MPFFWDNLIILAAISDDCDGEPPGELMIKATAYSLLNSKALSINGANDWSLIPPPNLPPVDIIPSNRRIAIVPDFLNFFLNQDHNFILTP